MVNSRELLETHRENLAEDVPEKRRHCRMTPQRSRKRSSLADGHCDSLMSDGAAVQVTADFLADWMRYRVAK